MIQHDISLKQYNTFGIDVTASQFARFSSVEELIEILNFSGDTDNLHILGGGSNILYTRNVDALVLKNEILGFEVVNENDESVQIKVGGGMVWHSFVLQCLENSYGGVENLSLIPGSVGASPMQNIGAYGVEIKDVFVSLEALNIATKKIETFNNEECKFGYRESIFKNSHKGKYIITSVTYRLTKNTHKLNTSYGIIENQLEEMKVNSPTIRDISNAVIAIRQSKLPDPNVIGNAGSFFKNPVVTEETFESLRKEYPDVPNYPNPNGIKLAAGWLIEKAGWKGKTFGNYGVHKKQALVLVNYSDATGNQVYDLSSKIIESVENMFGVTLEREVNIL